MDDIKTELPPSPQLATALTVQVQMDGGKRTLIAQTYIDRDADAKAYNAVLDRLGRAIDRQEDYYALQQLKRHIDAGHVDLAAKENDQLDYGMSLEEAWKRSGKKGKFSFSNTEAQTAHQKAVAVEQTRKALARAEKDMVELSAKLNGGA